MLMRELTFKQIRQVVFNAGVIKIWNISMRSTALPQGHEEANFVNRWEEGENRQSIWAMPFLLPAVAFPSDPALLICGVLSLLCQFTHEPVMKTGITNKEVTGLKYTDMIRCTLINNHYNYQ